MKKSVLSLLILLSFASTAFAVPTLQVGVPGASPGTYLPYTDSSNPDEDDTAVTTGNVIVVGGTQAPNAVHLGGAFGGSDWSTAVNPAPPAAFDGHGALLLITYAVDPSAALSLRISTDGGSSYHASDVSYSSLFFPNNHAPLQDSTVTGYAYFDIGNFNFDGTVPNFADTADTADGELKTIFLEFSGVDWAHFDVMALETSETGNQNVRTSWDLENNPGSHDVTWKQENTPVPEPGTITLVGLGLAAVALYGRRQRK